MTEDGDDYCGPIQAITIEGGNLEVILAWTACRPKGADDESWECIEHQPSTLCGVNTTVAQHSMPMLDDDGRISFSIYLIGPVQLFPKGASKLDPAKVRGLTLPT